MKSAPTFNTLALGSLRARKKQYRALTAGIALAIFFMSSMLLMGQSIYATFQERYWQQVGRQDAVMLNAGDVSPEALIESGYAQSVGSAYIIGETEGGETGIACYDDEGEAFAYRRCVEGRMPEAEGEIAVERSKLQKLRVKAAVGDKLVLSIKVPDGMGFLPRTVKKTYTLVGVLSEQSDRQSELMGWWSEGAYLSYPGAVVSREERVEAGGRNIVHRLVRFAPGVTREAFTKYAEDTLNHSTTDYFGFSLFESDDSAKPILAVGVLGAVLVLAACLGIVNAFSATLFERRQEIGMLRAVGATRRQIRSAFGREALLIALSASPPAVALSHLSVWGLSLTLKGQILFHAAVWFLPVELAFSLAVVMLAAFLPLMEASRVSPMQAIREVSLLRTKKKLRIRPSGVFWPPRLLAARHLKLYRTKQAGVAVMVALSVILLTQGFAVAWPVGMAVPANYDFLIYTDSMTIDWVEWDALKPRLTDGDLREAAALPLVRDVEAVKSVQVNLLMDKLSEYLLARGYDNGLYGALTDGENLDAGNSEMKTLRQRAYRGLRAAMRIDRDLVHSTLSACSEAMIDQLKPYVLDGSIDIAALNAGREVLVVAPEKIYIRYDRGADGRISGTTLTADPRRGERYDKVLENDAFHAGDPLDLTRLYTEGGVTGRENEDGYDYTAIRRVDRSVRIGAVLSGDYDRALSVDLDSFLSEAGPLVTTLTGLDALGFETGGYQGMAVSLSGTPDGETAEFLETALADIANRADDVRLDSRAQDERENRQWQMVLVACLAAVVILFFSICVSMVGNAVTHRIRSDKRAIGTLRAVGAPLETIVSSYWRQVAAMLGGGAVAGAVISAGFTGYAYLQGYLPDGILWPMVGLAALFMLLIFLFCGANLRMRIREVVSSSIVDNIREL